MADDKDFFAEETPQGEQQEAQESEKIKIGDKEYAQEDLAKLVNLGETASELEAKWNTKIDKLYPEYTKKSQKLSELEKVEEERARQQEAEVEAKAKAGAELSADEQQKLVKQELSKYGVVTKEDVNSYIANFMAAQNLITEVDKLLVEAKTDGKPTGSREDLLAYMDENGIKNPTAAYKLMFEDKLKEWEAKQINSLKKPGLETESSSTAGSKEPTPVKVTRDNISTLLQQAFEE